MLINTTLDLDLVAVENADQLTLLVELSAPTPAATVTRAPATLQVVLDRSGSMQGDRLDSAKTALLALVDRLDPTDNFGVVTFDDTVRIVVPAGPLSDKTAVKAAIAAVQSGGQTDLSAGYLRGLQEVRRVSGPGGATLLLVSDGHANAGVTDPSQLGKVAVEAQTHRVTTSTLGLGLGYDEALLSAIAQGGAGNELFAEEADTASALIAGEVDGLLEQVAQAASLRVRWTPHVRMATVLNDLPTSSLPDGFVAELGSFYAGETRRLVLTFDVPGIAALGLAEIATLELMHVSLPDLVQHTHTQPVMVNVVPGDQAAGRIPNAEVRSEALFQRTQQVKKQSSRLLSEGRVGEASQLLQRASLDLTAGLAGAPPMMAAELRDEVAVLEALAEEAAFDASRASKSASMENARKSRTRGRSSRGALVLTWADGAERLVLEEWELSRLQRLAPIVGLFNGDDGSMCQQVVDALPIDHPYRNFFLGAVAAGGVTMGRA